MPLGIDNALKKYGESNELSDEEKVLMDTWSSHSDKAKVTTLRMYPSTLEAMKEYIQSSNYKVVPDYAVIDKIITTGMKTLKDKGDF